MTSLCEGCVLGKSLVCNREETEIRTVWLEPCEVWEGELAGWVSTMVRTKDLLNASEEC